MKNRSKYRTVEARQATNVRMEPTLKRAAIAKARQMQQTLSEYVSRLVEKDLGIEREKEDETREA